MTVFKLRYLIFIVVIAIILGFAWIYAFRGGSEVKLRIATTTSLYATGLLEVLAEHFHEKYPGVKLEFVPVGSGEALRRAAQGDVCMVLVHAPSLEKQYIINGVLEERTIFAYNYFVIVGPKEDPARAFNSATPIEVFKKIYEAGEAGKTLFISRGDNSGTHNKELSIWTKAKLNPQGKSWYLETGSGMDATLIVANEKRAYTLSDISTFLKLKTEGRIQNLKVVYSGGEELLNIYSAYIVSTCTGKEREYATRLLEYLSSEAQEIIGSYGLEEFNTPLFNPAIDRLEWLEEMWTVLSEE